MNPDQWAQAKSLFGSLIERDPAHWPALLSGESDPDVVAQVQRLLEAHANQAQLLDKPALLSSNESDPLIGQSLGPFRIDALLGEGGGGRVYLAERTDVGGRAALKILRGRFASAESRRRFQAEQMILARLDHPNIARLLQVGITDDGTPWLAMEYVEGEAFSAAMAKLPIPARVRTIIKLLGAVDYAHRQLVVHRDLKPGNILIDAGGEPRLLDFGIAKRLDDSHLTQTQFQPRTPAYASPEQVRGEPISVATDVYAAGVLLYEVLSGWHPWLANGGNIEEAILGGEPALPSSRASGPARFALQGDLDAIVMQAMQRDPARRYAGAATMADDLQRYLEHRPVLAQKQTWGYRSRRFLFRNQRLVAAGVALAALLAVALVHERQLRSAAAIEAEKATQIADFMLDAFAAGDAQGTGFTLTKDSSVMDLMARGVTRLESLRSAPRVRADLAQKMGEVYWGYSEYGAAEALFKQALALRQTHLGASDATAASHLMLGRVYERTGRYPEMFESMQKSYEMRLQVLGADDPRTVHSLHRIGAAHYQLQQLDSAVEIARTAIVSWRTNLPEYNIEMANSLTILGLSQLRMGRFEEALASIEEIIRLRAEILPPDHNVTAEGYTNRSRVHFALGRVDLALADLRRSLAVTEKTYPSDHWDLVLQYEKLAPYLLAVGELDEAARVAERAVEMASRLHQRTPNPELVDLARHAKMLVLWAQGQRQPALALGREIVQSREQHLPPLHSNLLATRSVLAEMLLQSGDAVKANAELLTALDGWRPRPFGYIAELDAAMSRFASTGHCDWLNGDWPANPSARMAAALERDLKVCSHSLPAPR